MADLRFLGVPDREDVWVVRVSVMDVILVETAAGPLERVVEEATKKIKTMSQGILAAVTEGNESEPSSRDSTLPPPSMPPTPTKRVPR